MIPRRILARALEIIHQAVEQFRQDAEQLLFGLYLDYRDLDILQIEEGILEQTPVDEPDHERGIAPLRDDEQQGTEGDG